MCNSEKTLAEGDFFDLVYVNQDTLDTQRQYAFLRHCNGEMTLIVANFGDQDIDSIVRIPQHALDCAQMIHGKYECKELLSDETQTAVLTGDTTQPVHIAPHQAAIWRFTLKN